jgi:cytoskeletal protein RodZ
MIPNSDPLRRMNTPLVPEIKAEIGAALKAARLKKGQSLDAISQQTRISKRFLAALEENRFEEFPALAYLRGFLKSYCDFLDLDFEAYWRAIQATQATGEAAPPASAPAAGSKTSPASPAPKTPVQRPAPKSAMEKRPPKAPEPSASHPHLHASSAAPATAYDPAAGVKALLIAVVVAIGLVFWLRQGIPSGKAPVSNTPAPPSALQPVHQPVQPRLILIFREDSWLSLSADGQLLFEGRVPRNSKQEWTAAKWFSLRVPNPGALKLTLNGLPCSLPAADPSGTYRIESP